MRSLRLRMGAARPPSSPEVPHADSHFTACAGLGNLPPVVAPQLVPTTSRASFASRRRLVGRGRTKNPGRLAAAVPRLHRSLQLGGLPPDQSLVRRRDAGFPPPPSSHVVAGVGPSTRPAQGPLCQPRRLARQEG